MFNFQLLIGSIIGLIIGFIIAYLLFSLSLVTEENFNIGAVTNIIIALATVVATIIHYSSIQQKRKDRVWDMHKEILLNLSRSLSLVIQASEYYLELEPSYNKFNVLPRGHKPKEDVYENFKNNQEYAINAYHKIMSKELIDSLKTSKKKNESVSAALDQDVISKAQALSESLKAYKDLQSKLNVFIARVSGINNI